MRFAHISDTHLGFRQYGLSEREQDFYHAFEQAVRKMAEERPDFVIHSGDMFDAHRPQPRALFVAQRCLARLSGKGIPVYAITGNHDVLMKSGSMPPHVLFRETGVRLLTEEEPFHIHDGVFIGGIPYTSKYYSERLKESLSILTKKSRGHKKSILVLHQGIDRFLPQEYELRLEEIPKNFDYYALGHVHSRIVQDFGRGKLVYPGSTELWSANEYPDYSRKGKGFCIVDLEGDEPTVQQVDLGLRREIMKEKVDASGIDEWLAKAVRELSGMPEKPLLYLDVNRGDFDRENLHDRLLSKLSDLTLSLRVSYLAAGEKAPAGVLTKSFNIPEMIASAIKDKTKAGLALQLFRALSEGNEEEALKSAEESYGRMK